MKSIRYVAAATLVLLAAGCGDSNPAASRAEVVAPTRNVSDGVGTRGSGNAADGDTISRGGNTMGSGNLMDGVPMMGSGNDHELGDSTSLSRGTNTMGSGN